MAAALQETRGGMQADKALVLVAMVAALLLECGAIKGQTCLAASAACRMGPLAGMWTLVGHSPSS